MTSVVLSHVYKRYGEVEAVRDFNLDIKDKEFVVLVGPSGCGKSTTLRMVAGLEDVSQGEIFIDGRLVNDVPPKDRDIAMVFQDYALYPHMTVFENMSFSLRLRKLSKAEIEKKVMEAAKILSIEDFLKRRPKELSGGQRQRVAMGRAIVRSPKVFLFDEPLSNLDAKLRVQMRVEISQLYHRLKTNIIYVTHDQVEAMTLADRIVLMVKGIVQQIGTPMELFNVPQNAFVGSFIGSPSMNFIKVNVEREKDQGLLKGESFQIPIPPQIYSKLQEKGEKEVLLGIRPQHITPGPSGDKDIASVPGTIQVVEPMGTETFIHFKLDERDQKRLVEVKEPGRNEELRFHLIPKQNMIGCVHGISNVKVEDRVSFSLSLDRLHIFSLDGTLARLA